MLSLPTLAHPLSNADESPTTKQTRHAMAPSDVRRLPNGYPLPWAKRRQSMTLGGCQRMIADNCCRKSSNRSLAVIVAETKRPMDAAMEPGCPFCVTVLIGAGITGRASEACAMSAIPPKADIG